MKIYTKTGDLGETGLWGGKRVSKVDLRLEAYGTVDECNAAIGLALAIPLSVGFYQPSVTAHFIQPLGTIQHRLFVLGGLLASPEPSVHLPQLMASDVGDLETAIDALESQLPPLTNFILPGGSPVSAQLHMARTICRRAERACVQLHQHEPVEPILIQYLNRLSDYLFVAARYANQIENIADIPWEK